jgi:hypothetical protein
MNAYEVLIPALAFPLPLDRTNKTPALTKADSCSAADDEELLHLFDHLVGAGEACTARETGASFCVDKCARVFTI